jgi:hypothetical protein
LGISTHEPEAGAVPLEKYVRYEVLDSVIGLPGYGAEGLVDG